MYEGKNSGDSWNTEYARHWHRFKATGDRQSRNLLLIHYLPLAKYVASTIPVFNSRLYGYEDLVSWAVLGLIDALSRFRPGQGVKFETYAISRIRGEIMDNLRRLISPYRQRKQKIFERTFNRLAIKLGRSPTEKEMAEALGVDSNGYRKWLAYAVPTSIISLDEFAAMEGKFESLSSRTKKEELTPESLARKERSEKLAKAIQSLPEREKKIITLYYYEGLTLNEIAGILNLSKGRISQIHGHALLSLRQALTVLMNTCRHQGGP
ncbi:MAG TPA: FliA/WhiG family RNA polymerase sigma factor [bacterium]|nr:FliA/WhiG family RNA polymerase sigma factor [bacterium]HPP11116.1 FliA/WhiG family RNA polymerase sigma factor [bacterium]